MITAIEHTAVEAYRHAHSPSYGYEAVVYFDRIDYVHDDHVYHEHDGHYDKCVICTRGNCSDTYTTCIYEDCTCPTCSYNTCSRGPCDYSSCSSCVCEGYICPTCRHVVWVRNPLGP